MRFALPFLQALGFLIENLFNTSRQFVHRANHLLELQRAGFGNGDKAAVADSLGLLYHVIQRFEDAF